MNRYRLSFKDYTRRRINEKVTGRIGKTEVISIRRVFENVYKLNGADLKQELPVCILYSEPRFRNRIDVIACNPVDKLVSILVEAMENFYQLGVDKIVTYCAIIHYFLPRVLMDRGNKEDTTIYKVIVNPEDQYSIWPSHRKIPLGWRDVGKSGLKQECLEYIKEVWTDMRPLSLRKKMEESGIVNLIQH